MSDEAKRSFVASLYPGRNWKKRVSKMSNSQVLAIYFKEMNKRKEPKKENKDDDIPF